MAGSYGFNATDNLSTSDFLVTDAAASANTNSLGKKGVVNSITQMQSVVTATPHGTNMAVSSMEEAKIATLSWDDATWILTSSFIIFTMQTGKSKKWLCH